MEKTKMDAGSKRNQPVANKFILTNLISTQNGLESSGLLELIRTSWRFL